MPDFASMVKIVFTFVLTAKISGNATLGDPNLNAFHPSSALNRFTSVSSQLYPLCLRVFAIFLLISDEIFSSDFLMIFPLDNFVIFPDVSTNDACFRCSFL